MNKILELRKKLHGLSLQLRTYQGEENPDTAKIDAIGAEIRALCNQIETEEALARLQGEVDPLSRSGEATPATEDQRLEESRAAIIAYMRTGDRAQLRAMTSGVTGGGDTGGYLIPTEWENQIIEQERDMFVMRQLADVQTSASDRKIPVVDDHGESEWIDEGGNYPESDASFKQKMMEAHKIGRICKVSEELLQDNEYNLESWLTDSFAYTNGIAMEEAYIQGDGVGKPTGFLIDADAVAAKGTTLSYGDLLSLFAELKAGYFARSHWLMNNSTLVKVMSLKDDAGSFLYKPFEPKTPTDPLGQILGRPVVISSGMPDVGTSKKPVALGDFKRYRIHDRAGFAIQRLNELFAASGFIGFRGMQRTDGKLLIGEAIKALTF